MDSFQSYINLYANLYLREHSLNNIINVFHKILINKNDNNLWESEDSGLNSPDDTVENEEASIVTLSDISSPDELNFHYYYNSDDEFDNISIGNSSDASSLNDTVDYWSSSDVDSDDAYEEEDYKYVFPNKQYIDLYNEYKCIHLGKDCNECINKSINNPLGRWSSKHIQSYCELDTDKRYFKRQSGINRTDLLTTEEGVTSGIHMWTINWPYSQHRIHSSVGFLFDPIDDIDSNNTKRLMTLENKTCQMLGRNNENDIGWNLLDKKIYFTDTSGFHYANLFTTTTFCTPSKLTIVVDFHIGKIGLISRNKFMGYIVHGINKVKIYPVLNITSGSCIKLHYHGSIDYPQSLKDICCEQAAEKYMCIEELPVTLKSYIYKHFYP